MSGEGTYADVELADQVKQAISNIANVCWGADEIIAALLENRALPGTEAGRVQPPQLVLPEAVDCDVGPEIAAVAVPAQGVGRMLWAET